MPNSHPARGSARPPWLAILAFALGGSVAVGCHRDSVRIPRVIPAFESGPRTTRVEGRPTPTVDPVVAASTPPPQAPQAPATASTPPIAIAPNTPAAAETVVLAPVEPAVPARGGPSPIPVAAAPPVALPTLPSEPEPEPAATPLLDAAIARTEAIATVPAGGDDPPIELPPRTSETPDPPVSAANQPVATPDPPLPVRPGDEAAPAPPAELAPRVVDPLPLPASAEATPPRPIDPEKPAARREPPVESWPETLDRLRALAHRRADEPGDEAKTWAVRARLLDWVESGGTTPEQSDVLNRLLSALAPAAGTEPPDEPAAASSLRDAIDALEAMGPIGITELQLCRVVRGFSAYEALDAAKLQPGQALILYCELAGLRYEAVDGGVRSRLEARVELVPRSGGDAVWTRDLGVAEDLCKHRRRDYYVNYRLTLPATLAPGGYTLRLTTTDVVAEQSAAATIGVEIQP